MFEFQQRTLIQAPIQRCFDLARSIEVHLKANSRFGERVVVDGGLTSGLPTLGQRVTWRAKHFGMWQDLTSEMTALRPPFFFQNTMLSGAFRSMQADHYFRSMFSGATEMLDRFRIAAPLPLIGRLAETLVLRRYLAALNHQRTEVIKEIAESADWSKYIS